jgi:hypothetical protein
MRLNENVRRRDGRGETGPLVSVPGVLMIVE